MDFKVSEIINHPINNVYEVYRDMLPDLVPYLPNVDDIVVEQREEADGRVKMLNRWKVNGSIPRAVRPFFNDKMLSYADHADWVDADRLVNWHLVIGAFPEAVKCGGTNYFKEPGEVLLTGELTVDLSKIRGVPRLLRRLSPTVEKFVLELVKPNLSAVTSAVARYLDEQ